MTDRSSGVIVRIVLEKGFGFLRGSDGVEYFFHRSAVEHAQLAQLSEGDPVTFVRGEGSRGPRAEQVQVG